MSKYRTGTKTERRNALNRLCSGIWSILREREPVRSSDIIKTLDLSRTDQNRVFEYLSCLAGAGYLWREPVLRAPYYLLVNDTGPLTPARLHGGRALFDPNTSDTILAEQAREQPPADESAFDNGARKIWRAMRMLRHFTPGDLACITEENINTVRELVETLVVFDYLRQQSTEYGETTYMLPAHRNTGENPPAITGRILYDHKTREIIFRDAVRFKQEAV